MHLFSYMLNYGDVAVGVVAEGGWVESVFIGILIRLDLKTSTQIDTTFSKCYCKVINAVAS